MPSTTVDILYRYLRRSVSVRYDVSTTVEILYGYLNQKTIHIFGFKKYDKNPKNYIVLDLENMIKIQNTKR